MKPVNLEHAFRQADRAARRRAYIDSLALRLLIDPEAVETLVIACLTPDDAKEVARDLKAAVARLTKGRT